MWRSQCDFFTSPTTFPELSTIPTNVLDILCTVLQTDFALVQRTLNQILGAKWKNRKRIARRAGKNSIT